MQTPNIITLSRLPMLFGVVILLYIRKQYFATGAFVMFVIASWTDWLDGYVARRWRMTSDFGAFFDALTDKIFMIGIMITMFIRHILPEWSLFLVLIILTRELLITGLRAMAAIQKVIIPAQKSGKVKTVVQMISVATLLGNYAIRQDFPQIVSIQVSNYLYILGVFCFCWATILTVTSGIQYFNRFRTVIKDV